ncbi:MAG TPA: ABC transporter substrate-binding protein [Candidatus Dormibacteraeota bacterium]|nr:ABC transporter substrate-binding protein [Candidatus Dormibacteraeota bacterium]
MSTSFVRRLRSVAALCTLVALAIAPIHAGAAPQPIKIGAVFPFSGPLALLGQDSFDGANVALQMVNAQGGIHGRKLEWVKADAPNAEAANTQAERLISQQGLKILFGSYASPIAVAASQVAERHKVIYWEEGAWTTTLFNNHPKYVFRVNVYAGPAGEAAVQYAVDTVAPKIGKNAKTLKVAIVNEDGPFGTSVAGSEQAEAQKLGIDVVSHLTYNATTNDMTSLVLKLKASNPDVVLATSYINDATLLVKTMRAQAFRPKAIIGASAGFGLLALGKNLGSDVNGILEADAPTNINPKGLPAAGQALYKEFAAKFKAETGREPDGFSYMGFVGAYALFHDVLPKAKDPDNPDDVRAAAMAANVPEGTYPNGWGLKFDASGQNTRMFAAILQWQKESPVPVVVAPPSIATHPAIDVPLPPW